MKNKNPLDRTTPDLEPCERCGDDFDPRELNNTGLCRECERDEEREQTEAEGSEE